jgi:hypothetical protein
MSRSSNCTPASIPKDADMIDVSVCFAPFGSAVVPDE